MNRLSDCHRQIADAYPELDITSARLFTTDGQFSDVLVVNDHLVFRFPRLEATQVEMAREVKLLRQLQGRFTLPIPNPIYEQWNEDRLVFMGYERLPGEPLWNETLEAIMDAEVLQRLARQLAGFLREMHGIPLDSLDIEQPVGETRNFWTNLYQEFRNNLFHYMRADSQADVSQSFEAFLSNPANFDYQPVLRHGDYGGSNILYDRQTQSITGVIDFTSAGPGDPAQDAGALSCFGLDFFERCCSFYPELKAMMQRAHFYRSTYALQQALYALRDGNQDDFEDGIRDYC